VPKKLKVYRTAIGFHDAYVAATSQKAALQAWGVHNDLFVGGFAEQVTDPTLSEEPLAKPGQVIKRARGSEAEHLASLSASPPKPPAKPGNRAPALPKPVRKLPPRPSPEKLDAAEQALRAAQVRQEMEMDTLRQEEARIQKEQEALGRKHRGETRSLEEAVEKARRAHDAAMERWRKS
jgi:hypothetical protein